MFAGADPGICVMGGGGVAFPSHPSASVFLGRYGAIKIVLLIIIISPPLPFCLLG